MKYAVVLAALVSVCAASAGRADAFVFPGGFIVGTTAGIAAATRTFDAGPPAPPAPYVSGYLGYAGRGPSGTHCWIEPEQEWDGYGFVVARVRSCH
ncbi:MAG: hypothetical protein ACLQL2_01145 [Methylovirgula sp.]